ncbi:hypothetical protein COV88_02165 [Candidatus Saccharibacteria bacterium CG11_big_fil_rev_8_21_14_0_20_41_19]|nr:MAG: hypothetical protein COV88_02165 [Candidatus Saccharibacteria bacterium CG11_big_fil_rev_8_21_14_0_20_41_19]PIZ61158.1 MAG: hypothetical protein COY18_00040 [Candidatus Saccharibacteria bacterium CG_4_10_14_0_2_um_filter_41_11]PJC29976.1 MAG: hypothetical protein CO052_00435 [Candidatus Saccharibacteria bacterium CG_4_9_14_0_2_um_filter_41_9]PJE65850.1 MAG: hypothetical protein COU92_03840 [Candidatus Saccharibacteria bacterium CG10_big_fil_rev_8_21_14_0_10_41_32]
MKKSYSFVSTVLKIFLGFVVGALIGCSIIILAIGWVNLISNIIKPQQTIVVQPVNNISLNDNQAYNLGLLDGRMLAVIDGEDNSTTSGNSEVTTFVRTFQVQAKDNFDIFCKDPDNTSLCYGGIDATDESLYKFNFAGKFGQANHDTFDQLVVGEWYTCKVIPDLQSQLDDVYYVISACEIAF